MIKCLAIFSIVFTMSLPIVFGQEKLNCPDFPQTKNDIYVIAHRGVHNGVPENSLAAYQKAIDLGCDFVEIDVRTTKDGHFVSIHNSAIDAYAEGKSGKVSEMTLAELKALDIGLRIGPEWKNTRIPTFEEILQLCKGKIGIYLDLKAADVAELMKIIRSYDMESDIVWYIPAVYLMEMENINELFGASFIMPDPGSEENLEKIMKQLPLCVIATDMGGLSESFVEKAHAENARVFVDEKKGTEVEWKQILKWKTDGIQTDNPEKLLRFLKNKN